MGRVLLRRETAHRGGKTVIVVYDFATHLPVSVIEKVEKKLRAACSTGGTVKDRIIEIQGDQVAKIRSTLEAEGFVVGRVREAAASLNRSRPRRRHREVLRLA